MFSGVITKQAVEDALRGKSGKSIRYQLARNGFLSRRYPYFYMASPKCACTAVKSALWAIEGLPLKKNGSPLLSGSIHSRPDDDLRLSPAVVDIDSALESLFGQSVIRFCIWRDPVSRLVSAFCDKIRQGKGYYAQLGSKMAVDLGYESASEIPFDHFVEIVCDTSDEVRDVHWKSQRFLTLIDAINYNFIINVDDLYDGMRAVIAAIGAPSSSGEMFRRRYNVTDSDGLVVSASARKRIENAYSQDYELFGRG